ncbi:MAG: type IX secretion system protein PorQ [Flavobacteriales bacterium]
MRKNLLLPLLFIPGMLSAQLGGQQVFRVLDIPASARASALGGNYIAVKDNDINLGLFNPALLNADMGRQVALSWLPYFEGINVGYASYAHHFDSLRTTFSGAIQYVDYGTFNRTDETGNELGQFHAGEYAFQVGAGRAIDSLFSIGANIKFITSNLDTYTSSGIGLDLGGTYHKPSKGVTLSAVVRNIGYQTSSFTSEREKLPLQVMLGVTYKFKHAPFRLGLMLENLQRWDLTYPDATRDRQIDPATGEVVVKKTTNAEKALLHAVPSAEILLSKNFMIRLGYNFRTRYEMALASRTGAVGLSFGLGLRVSKVHISYGFNQLHLAGIRNTITIAVRFSDFKKAEG